MASMAEMAAKLAAMEAALAASEAAAAKAKAEAEAAKAEAAAKGARGLTVKITPKGCVAVYGIWANPVALYPSGWERLLSPEMIAKIRACIADNAETLRARGEASRAAKAAEAAAKGAGVAPAK